MDRRALFANENLHKTLDARNLNQNINAEDIINDSPVKKRRNKRKRTRTSKNKKHGNFFAPETNDH